MKWEVSWPQSRGTTVEVAGLTFVNGEVKVFDSFEDIPEELRNDERFPCWAARFPLARVDSGYRSYPLTEDRYNSLRAKQGGTPEPEPPKPKPKRKPRTPKPPTTGTKPDAPAEAPEKPHTGEDDG